MAMLTTGCAVRIAGPGPYNGHVGQLVNIRLDIGTVTESERLISIPMNRLKKFDEYDKAVSTSSQPAQK